MNLQQELIQSFDTTKELDQFIANLLIEEMQKPGLVMLPVGKTFEDGIYPQVNHYFSEDENRLRDEKDGSDIYREQHYQVHPQLSLTHLDELIDAKTSFGDRLASELKELVNQCGDRFYKINPDDIPNFERFIRSARGPRLIVLGLGADPNTAHVAFIGEDYINSSIDRVELTEALAAEHGCKQAVTIGTDIFRMPSIEAIIVVAKGKNKAKALAAAFDDPDTGLGYLIKYHADKLKIYTDQDAIFNLKH
ncbi:MAG: hypothetical protein OXU45_05070 [Candidatus Melainabacteria bacterium]|nr:hypothetical protein [Candidatus Melainabacteria bacterium]